MKVAITYSDLPLTKSHKQGREDMKYIRTNGARLVACACNILTSHTLHNEADRRYARAATMGITNDTHARCISA